MTMRCCVGGEVLEVDRELLGLEHFLSRKKTDRDGSCSHTQTVGALPPGPIMPHVSTARLLGTGSFGCYDKPHVIRDVTSSTSLPSHHSPSLS